MENVTKYFVILENLKFFTKCTNDDIKRIEENLKILQKYTNTSPKELANLATIKRLAPVIDTDGPAIWTYVCYLFHVLLTIKEGSNFNSSAKEDLISIQHVNLFKEAVIEISRYGNRSFFLPCMKNHPLFRLGTTNLAEPSASFEKIKATLRFLSEMLPIKDISSGSFMDPVILEAMAGVYSIHGSNQNENDDFKKLLTFLWEHTSKKNYLKNLLIIKSIPDLPVSAQQQLHADLLEKLNQPGGFQILAQNVFSEANDNVPQWKQCKIISNIVARKGHSKEFYENMINQIFEFINGAIDDDNLQPLLPAGVITLRNLYVLNEVLKNKIKHKFDGLLKPLYEPEDLLTGVVVMEDREFKVLVNLFFACFCGSGFEILPSEILIKYLPIFMSLYDQIPQKCNESGQIKSIILQVLSNREKLELTSIISWIISEEREDDKCFKQLHSRISVSFNEKFSSFNAQVVPVGLQYNVEQSSILMKILKSSNNNILIYNVFICILNLLDDEIDERERKKGHKIDLIHNQEEFDQFLTHKFKKKLTVISCLTDLITFKPFHSQFHENPAEILNFIDNFLKKRIENNSYDDETDEILPVTLAIFQEFLETSNNFSNYMCCCKTLKTFLKQIKSAATRHQVESLISLIEGGTIKTGLDQSQYNFARSLMDEIQPHLRVYGMSLLIKLLNDKDEETLVNRHAILAIALHALRDEESYLYLNCVRLLLCLVNVLEAEVLEALSAEYLNENELLEYRLKVGEAVLKVTEDLGPITYKYKDVLINCFLHGCKNKSNEFRASSFSNLASICRILSYQIHNFFQELIAIIGDVLQTETYLPAKRSAVMVLSQLLRGMESITDYQEYLLPLYKQLCFVVENETDEVTRVHAMNGLKTLSEKCKEFLFPQQKLEKEIKIFGVKDSSSSKKANILELS